ncbi:MAG TPA: DUF1080 domain-containing protein [Pirellulales bacterium]|nr:DUF1080 domain-containing protein [Pirellulales bacterium]
MRIRLIAIACIVLFLGAPLFAETATATGIIEGVDAKARTITVRRKTAKGEKTATLTVAPQVEVLVDGRRNDLSWLKAGQTITVNYDTAAKQVISITVSPAKPSGDSSVADDEADFEPIFNGNDLDGWDGDPKFWTVKNGAITGQTTPGNLANRNTFIIWRQGNVGDFELRLSYRILAGNSGVQYRSSDLGDHVVTGYQCDIEVGDKYSGVLFEEGGRGILAQRGQNTTVGDNHQPQVTGAVGDSAELQRAIKKEGWNDCTIVAQGNRLQHFINGKQMIDVTDNDRQRRKMSGVVALQLHAGPPMTVQFKNIRLKRTVGKNFAPPH